MVDAEIKDEDTQAAMVAFEKDPRGWGTNKIIQVIANARAEGRRAREGILIEMGRHLKAHEAGVQEGLEQAAERVSANISSTGGHIGYTYEERRGNDYRNEAHNRALFYAARSIRALMETKP